jgi:hypothetical protein
MLPPRLPAAAEAARPRPAAGHKQPQEAEARARASEARARAGGPGRAGGFPSGLGALHVAHDGEVASPKPPAGVSLPAFGQAVGRSLA